MDGLNLYAYCRNNPVCYVDPSGNCCESEERRIQEDILIDRVLRGEKLTQEERRKLIDKIRDSCAARKESCKELEAAKQLGLIVQVGYGSTDLSIMAIEYRKKHNDYSGKNIAIFEYEHEGQIKTIMKLSGNANHAERLAARELTEMGIQPFQVKRIYSEYEPCIIPGGYCRRFLLGKFRNAEITYSFEYGDSASRDRGRKAFGIARRKLRKNNN